MQKLIVSILFSLPLFSFCQEPKDDKAYIQKNFVKLERMVPMRDGVRLFTAIYIPRQAGRFPILMERTPYSCSPYGELNFPSGLGPNSKLLREPYIFVYQDVRGRYRSEGQFEEMTPAIDNKAGKQTDESSDAYDTIDWLLKSIGNNNGSVGIYGISYPGFYATASLPNAHPALKAVSPQAPVTDEFIGDDAYHNGAFFLQDNFDFTNYFEGERIDSGERYKNIFELNFDDAYEYFLHLGPIKNTNNKNLFNHKSKIWDEYLAHDTYDDYWRSRNIRTHLKDVKPAVLVVGGWFDAEDMFGALHTYQAIEKQTPANNNRLLMGPWSHGAWAAPEWTHFGTYSFGENVNKYFEQVETDFFNFYLKNKSAVDLAEATIFVTGSNEWKTYSTWPPRNLKKTNYYLGSNGNLSTKAPSDLNGADEFQSDPTNPVPYTNGKFKFRNNQYLVEDQRFASSRPDVLVYQTDTIQADLLVTGSIKANLFLTTTGTDLDIIIKIIDVQPERESGSNNTASPDTRGGFQRLVRADVFRGKFRNGYEKPEPFKPGEIANISFELNDIAHKFKKGHRIMVQIQSSWFPLVDINPQTFTDIPKASESDFQKASVRIFRSKSNPSSIELPLQP
jgi:uncharacterized protein